MIVLGGVEEEEKESQSWRSHKQKKEKRSRQSIRIKKQVGKQKLGHGRHRQCSAKRRSWTNRLTSVSRLVPLTSGPGQSTDSVKNALRGEGDSPSPPFTQPVTYGCRHGKA